MLLRVYESHDAEPRLEFIHNNNGTSKLQPMRSFIAPYQRFHTFPGKCDKSTINVTQPVTLPAQFEATSTRVLPSL